MLYFRGELIIRIVQPEEPIDMSLIKKLYYKPTHCLRFVILTSFAVLLYFTPLPAISAEIQHQDGLTVNDIIKLMREEYAMSKSYSDSGVVKIVLISSDGRRTVKKPFTTAFIRPDRFRFEYREKTQFNREHRFIVYRRGKDLQTYWDIENDLKLDSLDKAIGAATGISGGSAITVPAMLLPSEIKWRRAIRFNNPKRIDDGIFNNVSCFRIQDQIFGSHVIFWIDKEKFLLLKIYRESEYEDFQTQETTTYRPIKNGKVSDMMLEFNPPGEKRWWQLFN
jgi:outer membrane lipoprotein-sorting protein